MKTIKYIFSLTYKIPIAILLTSALVTFMIVTASLLCYDAITDIKIR